MRVDLTWQVIAPGGDLRIAVLVWQPSALQYFHTRRDRIEVLTAEERRYGDRRIRVVLCRKGGQVNGKHTDRLYREAGLAVRGRRRNASDLRGADRCPSRLQWVLLVDGLWGGCGLLPNLVPNRTRVCGC
nr:MAG: hypothetical protein DIU57_09860 [Pseudomonadota bacterium]